MSIQPTTADRPAADVTPATQGDLGRVTETLSDAFYDDPVFTWLCPDPERRRIALPGWFSVIAEGLHHHGSTFVTSDRAGAAVWVPPDQPMVTDPEQFSTSIVQASPPDAERFGAMLALLDEHHPQDTHWYLFLMGVQAGRQGEGIGSRLLRAVLDECDRDGIPAYLEATCDRNRRLYERHGFEVVRDLALPDGPVGFAMWREPQPPRP